MPTLKLIERWPGVFRIEAPFSRELNAQIKSDYRWWAEYSDPTDERPKGKFLSWNIPVERADELEAWAEESGWDFGVKAKNESEVNFPTLDDTLTPWQEEGLGRAIGDRVALFQWITGAGKSRGILEVYKELPQGSKALIVCPKVVLRTWETEQLPRWIGAPEPTKENPKPKPPWWALIQGRKIPEIQPAITLVSYGSLHNVPKSWEFDLLVYDELHNGIHGNSRRSKACVDLSMRYPEAIRIGLTATPTSSSLTDLWSQLHILCPHRYGPFAKWWRQFFVEEPVGFEDHTKPGPLKQEKLSELLAQLNTICHYVGHEDVGDALPPVKWHEKRYGDPATGASTPETVRQWVKEQRSLVDAKIDAFVRDWGRLNLNNQLPDAPTAIVVYHRELGERLAERLGATYVSGELPPKKRHAVLADAQLAVLTMRSVTEGLDLRRYTNVHVLEAYPVPLYLTQVLGRFVRLYATNAVDITFWRLRGSSDDVIVHRLLTRMSEHSKLVGQGKVETGLQALLTMDPNSDAFLEELRAAVANMTVEETEDWEEYEEDWEV